VVAVYRPIALRHHLELELVSGVHHYLEAYGDDLAYLLQGLQHRLEAALIGKASQWRDAPLIDEICYRPSSIARVDEVLIGVVLHHFVC